MDPISSVSSLQHRLAVFLPLFFLLFFFLHISLSQTFAFLCFVFPFSIFGFASPRAHFQLTPSVSHSHVRGWHKASTGSRCLALKGRLTSADETFLAPSPHQWDLCEHMELWLPPMFQPRQRADTTKTCFILRHRKCTDWLYRKRQLHDCKLPCAEQSHSSEPLSFHGKTSKKKGGGKLGISRQAGTVAKRVFIPLKTFKCLFEALCPSSLSCSNFPVLWGKRKKSCHKRGIRAYFQWMSQHVEMGKALQTVCITKAIINI